jgi:predicted nucleic acid-binding protein
MYLRGDPVHISEIHAFLTRVIKGEIEAFIGLPVLDELYYRLLLGRIKDAKNGNPLLFLRKNIAGAIAEHGVHIETAMRKLMILPHIHLIGCDNAAADFESMLENIRKYSLLPRDAIHVAIMKRNCLNAIASDDMDFDRVANIERHWIVQPPEVKGRYSIKK